MGEVGSSEIDQTVRRTLRRTSLQQAPWWLIILGLGIVFVLLAMIRSEDYARTLGYVLGGVGLSVFITVVAYVAALVIGLIVGLGRVSTYLVAYHAATLYVEVMRGLPMLVIILIHAVRHCPDDRRAAQPGPLGYSRPGAGLWCLPGRGLPRRDRVD
ncbi:MAG: hypothetical protein WCF99_18030 [Chloroflexales bacterium]